MVKLVGTSATLPSQTGRRKAASDRAGDIDAQLAACVDRLHADSKMLDHLWQTRGISAKTARRFELGVSTDRRYWVFPIQEDGRVVALKMHRTGREVRPKCKWTTRGTGAKHLYPVKVAADGPVFLCPGELKALAVIEAGHSAVGITCGETVELPAQLLQLLDGRTVAVPTDDDRTGRKWLDEKVRPFFANSAVQLIVPNLGLDAKNGLKDIGDLITKLLVYDGCTAEQVRGILMDACDRADSWNSAHIGVIWRNTSTWEPVEHIPTGLRALDGAMGGGLRIPSTTLLAGPPGHGKSQLAIQICTNIALRGTPVGIISLELEHRDVARLVMSQLSGVPRQWLDGGELDETAAAQLREALEQNNKIPLTVLDEQMLGVVDRAELGRIVAHGVHQFGWKVVLLDYLGLLASPETDRSEYQADLLNSAAIKNAAKGNNVAILAVASLRKTRPKEDPRLEDIAGAGRLGYDATNAFILNSSRPLRKNGELVGIMKLVPRKMRFSASGANSIQLRWRPEYGIVCDLEGNDE